MQHSPDLPPPAWNELESAAAQVSQQLSSRQLAFSNEQPPPALFEHLIPPYEICDAIHSSAGEEGGAPLLRLLQRHPLVLNVYNSSIVARLMREGAGAAPHLHSMQHLPPWTVLRAAQNEAWCSTLLLDGDKFASDKNFEHAHRCYDQALQMNSDSVAAWLCKAQALFAASTFDDAIQCIGRAQQIDCSNADAEKLMQQVKTRIQEITGAVSSGGGRGYSGAESAVDKARAKLGIHNKSAEQDLAAFDAELLVREDSGRLSSNSSSRHKDRRRDRSGSREDRRRRRRELESDGDRHRDRDKKRDKERGRDRGAGGDKDRSRDKHHDRDRERRERDREEDGHKDRDAQLQKRRHGRQRRRHRSASSSSSGSSSSCSK